MRIACSGSHRGGGQGSRRAPARDPGERLTALQNAQSLFRNLQEQVLRLRLVPLGPTFERFRRATRDLAAAAGKQAELVVEGADVEVDMALADALRDRLAIWSATPSTTRRHDGRHSQRVLTRSSRSLCHHHGKHAPARGAATARGQRLGASARRNPDMQLTVLAQDRVAIT